jgi:hypothetical protein
MRRLVGAALVAAWAGACVSAGGHQPHVDPGPSVRYARVTVWVGDGQTLGDGVVSVSDDFGHQVPCVGVPRLACQLDPAMLPGWALNIQIEAPGFQSVSGRARVQGAEARLTTGSLDLDDITLRPAHRDPWSIPEAQVRAIRANLSGVYLDEIKPQCPVDPQTGIACTADNHVVPRGLVDGAFFSANYRLYTDAQRQVIRDVWTGKRPDSRGIWHAYTHMAISLFCHPTIRDYHGVYPPCGQAAKISLNDALHELYDNDPPIIPIGFVMGDWEPDDLTTPLSVAGTVDPDLLRIVEPYWEHYEVACATLKVHQAFPRALVYYHNPIDTDGPYGDACYPGAGAPYPGVGAMFQWLRDHTDGKFAGVLLQTDEIEFASLRGRIADFVASFSNGPRTGRVGAGWPSGLDTVWFEDIGAVYNNFWGGGDAAALEQRVNAINHYVVAPLCEDGHTREVVLTSAWCGTLAGFGSGGVAR